MGVSYVISVEFGHKLVAVLLWRQCSSHRTSLGIANGSFAYMNNLTLEPIFRHKGRSSLPNTKGQNRLCRGCIAEIYAIRCCIR